MILREWLQHGNADRGRLTNSRIILERNPIPPRDQWVVLGGDMIGSPAPEVSEAQRDVSHCDLVRLTAATTERKPDGMDERRAWAPNGRQ